MTMFEKVKKLFQKDLKMVEKVSSKSFAEALRNKSTDGLGIEKTFSEILPSDGETMRFVFSSKTVDHAGDVVYPEGVDFSNYMAKNPIILLHHDMNSFPIGKTVSLNVVDNRLIGEIEFFKDIESGNVGDNAKAAVELLRKGVMGVSITFVPKEVSFNNTDGLDIKRSVLVETSVVTVPCCTEAFRLKSMEDQDETISECDQEADQAKARSESRKRKIAILDLD